MSTTQPAPDSQTPESSTLAPPAAGSEASGGVGQPRSRSSTALVMWLAVLLVFAGACTLWAAWKLFQRSTAGQPDTVALPSAAGDGAAAPGSDESWIKEFTLTERSGRPFDSRDLQGKVWVASFFFATCPSFCVQQNQHVKSLYDDFAAEDLTFVSITCDPKQDTPEKLREYARRFDADPQRWLFLTGDLTYIRRIGAERFGQPVHEQTHKNSLVVVDKWGETRGSFDWADEDDMRELKELLPRLLREEQPPQPADEQPAQPTQPGAGAAGEPEGGGESDGESL